MSTLLADTLTVAAVCPAAPPGVQVYADQIQAWVKWGVLAILGICLDDRLAAGLEPFGQREVGGVFERDGTGGSHGTGILVGVGCTVTVGARE